MNPETLKNDIQRVTRELNSAPSATEYDDHGNHSIATLYKYLAPEDHDQTHDSKWEAILDEAGVGSDYAVSRGRPSTPLVDILTDVRRVSEELGRAPTLPEYTERGNHAQSTVTSHEHFTSWVETLRQAGCDPRTKPGMGPK